MHKELFLFDFDGTLTRKDSLFAFLRFACPNKYWVGYLIFLPMFGLAKLGLVEKGKAKESFISYFLKGKSRTELRELAQKFHAQFQPQLRKEGLDYIKNYIQPHHTGYLVSASLDIWLQPFAEQLGLELICTQAAYENEKYTGKFATKNCNYIEKKNRIEREVSLSDYEMIWAFGDSQGDSAMFTLADEVVFKPFRP